MAFIRCTNCDGSIPLSETYSCESCGASICSVCMDETNAQCPHCNSKVTR